MAITLLTSVMQATAWQGKTAATIAASNDALFEAARAGESAKAGRVPLLHIA
jgi:hypothetical protein